VHRIIQNKDALKHTIKGNLKETEAKSYVGGCYQKYYWNFRVPKSHTGISSVLFTKWGSFILFTYCQCYSRLTNSIKQSPSSKTNSHSDSQEIPRNSRRFITVFIRVRHWSISWAIFIQSIHFTTYFLKIHSNIILPSVPSSSKWSFLFRFSDQNFVNISNVSHACYTPPPPDRPWHLSVIHNSKRLSN